MRMLPDCRRGRYLSGAENLFGVDCLTAVDCAKDEFQEMSFYSPARSEASTVLKYSCSLLTLPYGTVEGLSCD